MSNNKSDADLLAEVGRLLGREPRGMEDVAVWNDAGKPSVIRVASLVDDQPFPTLFWLVDEAINYALDQLESRGLIKVLQRQILESEAHIHALAEEHQRYIQLRNQFMSTEISERMQRLGFWGQFQQKGIGGIADFRRVRCLHTYYAAHLVEANTVGRMLDEQYPRLRRGDITVAS